MHGLLALISQGAGGALLLAATGCITTRAEADAMRADIAELKGETAAAQRVVSDSRSEQQARLEALEKRIVALESTIASVRQGTADTGVQLERVISEVAALRGEVEEARHELGQTSATVQSILARPPVEVASGGATAPKPDEAGKPVQIGGQSVPNDPKPHYDFAKKLYDDKKHADAAEAFDLFLRRHGEHDLGTNAAFWKAEAQYALASSLNDKKAKEKALKQAILSYQRVLENPKSAKNDGALLKIGLAFEQLGFKDEAVVFYEELIAKHGKSPLVKEARARLKDLGPKKKTAKGRGR